MSILEQAKAIAKKYCGSYEIKELLLLESGDIIAIGFGYDGGYCRDAWCITNMNKHDGLYWSTYGFETREEVQKHLDEKYKPVKETLELEAA